MNLLLDTHTFLWFVWDDAQLSGAARDVITDADNRKPISAVICWESPLRSA